MLRKIALALVAIVVIAVLAVLGLASTKPDTMRIERKGTTAAAPATVYAILNDFHRFHEWSPWQKLDPDMKVDISGALAGTGSSYHWSGNAEAGEGRMTITDSQPDTRITMDLEFIKPFEAKNTAEFMLAPAGSGTEVTWVMSGKNNMMSKVMSVFMNMDAMVGKDFTEGLSNLARVAEREPAPAAADSSAVPTRS
jgi:carbon monoxide dehydrogenase subunit G